MHKGLLESQSFTNFKSVSVKYATKIVNLGPQAELFNGLNGNILPLYSKISKENSRIGSKTLVQYYRSY